MRPIYFTGAGIAVGLVEIIDHRVWELLPVAAVPLYCALRTYGDYVGQLDAEHRRREVIESLDQGMCVVDGGGRLTLWNDALERIVGVRREQALGDSLVGAMPALGTTELPRALTEALKEQTPRTIPQLRLSSGPASRDSPRQDAAGVERHDAALAGRHRANAQRNRQLKRSEERLRAGCRRRERRMVGMGPSHAGVLLLVAMA